MTAERDGDQAHPDAVRQAHRAAGWLPPMELSPDSDRVVPLAETPGSETAEAAEAAMAAGGALVPVGPPPRRGGGWGTVLAASVAALVAVAVGFDTADLMARAWATSAAFGVIVSLLLAGAGISLVTLLAGELRSLRRLRRVEALRAEAARLSAGDGHGEAAVFAGRVAALYDGRGDLAPLLDRFKGAVTDAHDDREVVLLVDRQVLEPLDRQAYQRVLVAARTTAIATALSPAAVVDLAVVLWRNLKLVREIAALYGARPGYLGSVRLLRRMLANLAVAGVTESAHHVAVEALGGSLAAAISTRVGQGVINGLLTARIGLAAMHLCRPVAYRPDNRPSLSRIRRELLSVSKEVL